MNIAMRQRYAAIAYLRQRRVREQRAADALRETATEQQVAIAMHQVQRHSRGSEPRKRVGHLVAHRIVSGVVAYPVLEQIAKDYQFGVLTRLLSEEAFEARERAWMRSREVQ